MCCAEVSETLFDSQSMSETSMTRSLGFAACAASQLRGEVVLLLEIKISWRSVQSQVGCRNKRRKTKEESSWNCILIYSWQNNVFRIILGSSCRFCMCRLDAKPGGDYSRAGVSTLEVWTGKADLARRPSIRGKLQARPLGS